VEQVGIYTRRSAFLQLTAGTEPTRSRLSATTEIPRCWSYAVSLSQSFETMLFTCSHQQLQIGTPIQQHIMSQRLWFYLDRLR